MFIFIIGIVGIIAGIIIFAVLKKNAGKKRLVSIIPIIFGIVLVVMSCVTTVPTGHTGVPTAFGKVSDYTLDAGLHGKLPWQDIIMMDNRVQKQSTALSCFSSDIQEVEMQYTVNYQIKKPDAMTIYSTIGKDYYNTVVVPCITEAVKTVTAQYTAENLIANRTELAQRIEEDLSTKLDAYNIILVSTSIEDMDFTDEFTNAVEAKQVAQQNKLRAETEAEQKRVEAQATADAQVIAAQGRADSLLIESDAQAQANKLIAESLTDEILNKMYYDKWNGILPSVMGSDSIVLMPSALQTEEE